MGLFYGAIIKDILLPISVEESQEDVELKKELDEMLEDGGKVTKFAKEEIIEAGLDRFQDFNDDEYTMRANIARNDAVNWWMGKHPENSELIQVKFIPRRCCSSLPIQNTGPVKGRVFVALVSTTTFLREANTKKRNDVWVLMAPEQRELAEQQWGQS